MLASLLAAIFAVLPQAPANTGSSDRPMTIDASRKDPATQIPAEQLRACTAAAERGLRWLEQRQTKSGAFTGIVGHKMNDDYVELDRGMSVEAQRTQGHGHIGVTAICGMAFLAGGHLPARGIHGAAGQSAIRYLIEHVLDTGFVTDAGTRMYSHAFATLFLAEVYGMYGGKDVKDALEKAINLIVDCQNAFGGWRYNPFDRELDLSVTVCQVQALRAARNIGIKVPEGTIDRAIDYVQRSRVTRGRSRGQFFYKILGRGAYEKPNEFAINAAALTALASAGIYDQELTEPALDFLERAYEDVSDYYGRHYYFWYGNYYACQAFFQSGGTRFRRYFDRLSQDLLRSQQADGRWINDCGPGDEFATGIACLLLQLPRQYLPILQR
ncbi:hypothetical protein LBMAG49_13710 [Planctomycetota bacterium]|nr:hypothetical protein LBMAG49_13710 [Planctomycetota bacterium]